MSKISFISLEHCKNCYNLIRLSNKEFDYFKGLGWCYKQFEAQLSKKTNFGLVIYNGNKLEGFIFGDLITIEKILEYEILLIYVKEERRNLGYASKLIQSLSSSIKKKKLKKIFLEVAANNKKAIELYRKNKFKYLTSRKNYYKDKDKKIDAHLFEKIIYE